MHKDRQTDKQAQLTDIRIIKDTILALDRQTKLKNNKNFTTILPLLFDEFPASIVKFVLSSPHLEPQNPEYE